MGRTLKVISAAAVTGVGLAGCVVFLTGEGLDRAEKWVSITGVVVSVAIGLVGLWLSWSMWRQAATPADARSVRNTGQAVAVGQGSRANTGWAGVTRGAMTVDRTGNAEARDGGWANTGRAEDSTP
jgi:ABC-type nickel/cobalt efflux system permease component RcnA